MRRIPVILQGTATDCGVVCLAMVLASFGKRIQVKEVREQIRTGRDGASAADICSAAKAYGLDACGVEASIDDLRRLASPAILHWTGAHFVVFCGWKGSHAAIIDPLVGPIRASVELLEASFSGTALIFQKSPDFRNQSLPRRDWNRYLAPLKGSWRGISAAFALSLVLRSSTLILPSLTSDLVDRILPDRSTNGLRLVTIGLMLMVIIAGLGGVIRSAVLIKVRTRYEIGLMGRVIAHLLRLPLTYFEQRTSVDIFARTSSARAVRDILSQQLLAITSDVIFLCAYFALMLRISTDMTGAVIAVATTQIAIAYCSLRTLKPLLRNELHLQTRTQSYLVEVLRALETIKAATAESHIEHTWRKLHATQMGASCNRERIASFFAGATSTADMSGPFVFLVLGAHLILRGRLSLGQLLGFNVLAACFLGPITSLVATVQGLQLVTVHLDRMDDVFDAEREPQCTGIRDDAWTGGLIELKHLSFRYSGSQRDALRDINLTVLSGKRIAIIGTTGSGKSTLTKILSGLYLPTSGELLLGGVDARSVDLQAWRRGMGFVPQRMALFNDTIAGNIAFHSETVSKEQLAVAAQVVEIMDDIECMPGKFETILAEDGTNLSGGQRQRICIARAIVRRPKLLILDEATSELDADTERRIYANIARMGITQVVVTHRLSSVFDADSIVVVHNGSIVEAGTHDELLNRGGYYGRMLRAYCGEAWAAATQAG